MRAWFFLPFADVLSLQTDHAGRLRRPRWPAGDTGHRGPGTSEFLRSYGALSQTPGREADGWLGRRQHVRVQNPRFRVPEQLDQRFDLRFIRRRVYGDTLTPRVFFELEVQLRERFKNAGKPLIRSADAFLKLQAHVPGEGAAVPISALGETLGAGLARALYRSHDAAAPLCPGAPLLIFSGNNTTAERLWVHNITSIGSASIIVIDGRKTPAFAAAMSRLHVDTETLVIIAEHKLRNTLESSQWDLNALLQYYDAVRRYRKRPVAYGLPDFQQLISEYDAERSVDWSLVESVFEPARAERKRKVTENINIWNRDGTVITGQVVNSFNTLNQRDPDLAKALAEVLEFSTRSGSPEAKDLAEELATKAEEGKKGVCRALWDGLVRTLPDVAKLGQATGVIAGWLAL